MLHMDDCLHPAPCLQNQSRRDRPRRVRMKARAFQKTVISVRLQSNCRHRLLVSSAPEHGDTQEIRPPRRPIYWGSTRFSSAEKVCFWWRMRMNGWKFDFSEDPEAGPGRVWWFYPLSVHRLRSSVCGPWLRICSSLDNGYNRWKYHTDKYGFSINNQNWRSNRKYTWYMDRQWIGLNTSSKRGCHKVSKEKIGNVPSHQRCCEDCEECQVRLSSHWPSRVKSEISCESWPVSEMIYWQPVLVVLSK